MSAPQANDPLRARGVLVCAVLLLCPLPYAFSLTSFLYPKAMLISVGVCLLALAALVDGIAPGPGARAYRPLLLGLLLTVVIHSFILPARVWTAVLVDGAAFATALLVALLAYPLWRTASWRARAEWAIVASGVLVALLGLVQYAGLTPGLFPAFPHYDQRMYSVFGNQDLLGGYLALVLPLLLHALMQNTPRRALFVAALLPVLLALMLSGSRSAWLAAAAGILTLRPWRLERRHLATLGFGVALIGVVASLINFRATWGRVFATFGESDVGGNARIWFWDGTLRMFADAPLLGVGLGNFAYWSPRYLGEALAAPGGEAHFHNQLHTLHAHSAPLEFLAETGLVGLVFALWWLGMLARGRGPAWGGLVALAVFACFNAPLHSPPHLLAGLVLAGMLLSSRDESGGRSGSRIAGVALALFAILLTGFQASRVWLPDYRLKAAEAVHLAGADPLPAYAAALGGRPVTDPWHRGELLLEYGLALAEAKHADARRVLDAAQSRIDTGELYLLLGETAQAEGDLESAMAYFRACLVRWPDSQRAFVQLYSLAGAAEQAELAAHARRWELSVPPRD